MKISLATEGLLDPSRLSVWQTELQRDIHRAVKRGMQTGGAMIANEARTRMQAAFKIKKSGFVRSLRARVLDQNPRRLPAVVIGSKIPWLGIHTKGGVIGGNMLIPLLPQRMGPKRFKAVITALLRSGNAWFVEKNGKTILMAENISENARPLAPFKRVERHRTGKRLQRGQDIPIAVLVKRVSLKRRFDLPGIVRKQLPVLASTLQRELNALT